MRNRSELAKVVGIILLLAFFCILPFVVMPLKDWHILLIISGVPILYLLGFGFLSDKFRLSINPVRLWNVSYFVVGFTIFSLSSIILYFANYPWNKVFLYSIGFGLFAVVAVMVKIFVWSVVKRWTKNSSIRSE